MNISSFIKRSWYNSKRGKLYYAGFLEDRLLSDSLSDVEQNKGGLGMENAVFIAKLLGPFLTVAGLGILFNLKGYDKVIEDFTNNSALMYLGGLISLVIGILIVLHNNIWTLNWELIITVVGWISLLKGIFIIVSPRTMIKMAGIWKSKTGALAGHSVFLIGFGVVLIIRGYF